MENIKLVVEAWENNNFIWFVNEKNRYNNFNRLYESEGNEVSEWSDDHIRMENYLRTGYRVDRGISVNDFEKIKNWGIEKYREYLTLEAEKRLADIVQRTKDVVGEIQYTEMLEYNMSSITRIKVHGITSDALMVVKFTEKNRKLHLKTWINETRRYF